MKLSFWLYDHRNYLKLLWELQIDVSIIYSFFYKCHYHYWNIDIFSAVQNVSTECNELINLWVSSVKIPMPHLHENVLTLINLQYSSYMQLNYIILQNFKYIAIRFSFIPYEHLLRPKECYDTYFIHFYKTM